MFTFAGNSHFLKKCPFPFKQIKKLSTLLADLPASGLQSMGLEPVSIFVCLDHGQHF
jgi:hypothetical protein